MIKKTKVAYVLALLLGFASVFGEVSLPIIHQDAAVVYAATPSAVYSKRSTTKAIYEQYATESGSLHDFGIMGLYYTQPDTITTDDGKSYHLLWEDYEDYDDEETDIVLKYVFENVDNEDDTVTITYTSTETITANSTEITFTLSSDDFSKITPSTITYPIKVVKVGDPVTAVVGEQYTINIGAWIGKSIFFTPTSSGTYTFSGTGSEDVAIHISYLSNEDESVSDPIDDLDFDDRQFGYESTTKKKSFSLTANHHYAFYANLWEAEDLDDEGTLTFTITKDSSSSSTTSSSNGTSTTSSSSGGSTSNTSTVSRSSSSSSSSSGGSSSSSSSSFSKGDSRTVGKGASAADYVRTGTTTVRYDASAISNNATTASIPATVKIGGKTYRVTTISAGAFKGNTNLKTVAIGKNIKIIGKGAFSGCTNLKTLTINTRSLTKKSIKGALSDSSVKTVRVPANKVDSYKNIFTKANTGSKGKVTVKAKSKK